MTKVANKLFSVSNASIRAGGIFISFEGTDPDIISVSIDSRNVERGDLFVALSGEVTDGHNYISMAVSAGASAVMISQKYYSENFADYKIDCCFIVVEDTLLGLQKLASSWVDGFGKLIKIAVTGSNGKSTTKEMIGSILSEQGSTITNKGNLNSETGLPLSVLKIEEKHKYGVFEMGINHPGEMKALVSVFSPNYALVTNIGTAHIGLMGSQKAIASEKSDIFSLFDKGDRGFVFEDDSWADYMESRCPGLTTRYGLKSTEGISGIKNLGLRGWEILYKDFEIGLKLVGQHNLTNALASISIAAVLGVSPDKIKRGLEKIEPLSGRSQVLEGEYTVIEDSYNANAESMIEIFNFISDLDWKGRIILVLGSMKELGPESVEFHKLVGSKAAELNPDLIFFFGSEMEDAFHSALKKNFTGEVMYMLDYIELERKVENCLKEGDLILLKGSRSMELNRLADKILKLKDVLDV